MRNADFARMLRGESLRVVESEDRQLLGRLSGMERVIAVLSGASGSSESSSQSLPYDHPLRRRVREEIQRLYRGHRSRRRTNESASRSASRRSTHLRETCTISSGMCGCRRCCG